MRDYQTQCLQILGDVDRLLADLKLLPFDVRCEIVSAIQRKLSQETELVTEIVGPESNNASDIEDDPSSDDEQVEEEINIIVSENGDILKLDQTTCETKQQRLVSKNSQSQIGTAHKEKRTVAKDCPKVGKCPVCNKYIKFHNNNDFKNHLKLHTGERKYKCVTCDKSFVSQSRLTYHKQNVHDPPKYQCSFCDKPFRSKVSYERHILVHSDEKPHQCEYCSYKARTIGNLTSHVRAVHDIKDYTVGGKQKLIKIGQTLQNGSTSGSNQLFNPLISSNSLSQDINNQCQELFIHENVTMTFEEFV